MKYLMQDSKKGLLPLRHGIPFFQDHYLKTLEEKECIQVVLGQIFTL